MFADNPKCNFNNWSVTPTIKVLFSHAVHRKWERKCEGELRPGVIGLQGQEKMKKPKTKSRPGWAHATVLRQLVELIPAYLVAKLARETGADTRARTFSPWSHVVAMLYAQVSHALGLNDVCDALRLRVTALLAMRGATPPARNTLSHANKERSSSLPEKLFWRMVAHLQTQHPGFARSSRKSLAWRFRRAIHVVDATTIQLVANCIDWARHRRRKAAAKCHLRLDLRSFLPSFALVETAGEHDNVRAPALCAGLSEGEIVLFDKAYVHFAHLWDLAAASIFWVTRAKDNLVVKVKKRLPQHADQRILKDELVVLKGVQTAKAYPTMLRRVTALVEIDGEERVMVFLTNNLTWSFVTVCDLYRCRWEIEVFFKQLKQTVQLVDFLGDSQRGPMAGVDRAPRASAALPRVAQRRPHSFTRLFTYVRTALWLPRDLTNCSAAVGQPRGIIARSTGRSSRACPGSRTRSWDSRRELSPLKPSGEPKITDCDCAQRPSLEFLPRGSRSLVPSRCGTALILGGSSDNLIASFRFC